MYNPRSSPLSIQGMFKLSYLRHASADLAQQMLSPLYALALLSVCMQDPYEVQEKRSIAFY